MTNFRPLALLALAALSSCATTAPTAPQDAFFLRLSTLCGQSFAGRVVVDTPAPTGADPFAGQPLVMHVRDCTPDTIRIPFHVGTDRSRTWVVTRTADGLRLKHDHRHADGTSDTLTMYGGDTDAPGTAGRQTFPADAESKAMFIAQDRAVSASNVWAMEVELGRVFFYELARPKRLFRVEFDLSRPIPTPPPAWGFKG
jgi:hypothetical protein